ncbi:TraR/DksA family transcriptional regulator [Serinibacter salmoneus]|uniref:TraR/DksA family transcriptional regulator n=1 Tax=Serinibacter salmoneus TaxID=556530 RepID=A0A2A9D4S1_9MICO|nr:TraR/DksA C4-type zinc finger protein [Serinibacter salmoneus]PFG20850.1 TraR/DksA family transcriptional regulator [Serinibacter salmoneus]
MDLRERLEALREDLLARLVALGASREQIVEAAQGANIDDEHDPEGATIAFEREQVRALSRGTTAQLAQVEAALIRMAEGTYGVCEVCGESIPEGRLEARPTASRCVRHA